MFSLLVASCIVFMKTNVYLFTTYYTQAVRIYDKLLINSDDLNLSFFDQLNILITQYTITTLIGCNLIFLVIIIHFYKAGISYLNYLLYLAVYFLCFLPMYYFSKKIKLYDFEMRAHTAVLLILATLIVCIYSAALLLKKNYLITTSRPVT